MKNAAVASRAGEVRRITTTHLGDGQPLTLTVQVWLLSRIQLQATTGPAEHGDDANCTCLLIPVVCSNACGATSVQAMSYSQGGHSQRVVRLQVVSPVSAAMERLLEIKAGKHASPHGLQEPVEAAHQGGSPAGSSVGGSERENRVTAEPSGADATPAKGGKR